MWKAVTFDDAARERIKAAQRVEKTLRLEGYLDLTETIGPFSLRQITVRDAIWIDYTENEILSANPSDEDIIFFIHNQQKDKSKSLQEITKIAATWLNKKPEAKMEIVLFARAAFNDIPAAGEKGTPIQPSQSWITSYLDGFMSEYGWTLKDCLELNCSVFFQLYQQMLKRHNGDKYAIRNPITQQARSMEIKRLEMEQSR